MFRPSLISSLFILFVLLSSSAFAQRDLNTNTSTLFSGSGNCVLCHGVGTSANITSTGQDVSPPSNWRSTMMANAARDPFWQAQVISESMDLPGIKDVIQDKCTNCHNPMGHEEAQRIGDPYYSLDEARMDGLAMDGVSCTLCHQVESANFGTAASFSGGYEIGTQHVIYGPYDNPLLQPMLNMTGYTPIFSSHIAQSEHCATCHTLFTPYVDAQGQIAGEFAEQTPYLEWKESAYPALGKQCQSCHMPALTEAIKISSLPMNAPARTPYFQHHFVGGNTFMLGVMKAHADEIGATALDNNFDSTIARTRTQLQSTSVRLSGTAVLNGSELALTLRVENLTGHKFPSGFPSRRAWLHVTVRDAQQRTVFESGAWEDDGEIIGHDQEMEAHYDRIDNGDQVQIYEAVLGNTDNEVTTRLLRAATYLKDNRLPPVGFTAMGMLSDTIGVVGVPPADADFNNIDGGGETGGDVVHYALSVDASAGPFTADVEMCYQTIKPQFIENMGRHDAPEITRMESYYDAQADKTEIIAQLIVHSDVNHVRSVLEPSCITAFASYPQPMSLSSGESAHLAFTLARSARNVAVTVYTLLGREIATWNMGWRASGHHSFDMPTLRLHAGMYLAVLDVEGERRVRMMTILP